MKKVIVVFACLFILNGCGANAAKKQLLASAGAFEASQIVIETRLNTPSVTEDEKIALKRYSEEGTSALKAAKFYMDQGQKDELSQQMALIQGLLTYIRYTLYPPTSVQEVPPPNTVIPE